MSDAERRWLAIPFSIHYEVPGVAEKLGSRGTMPPKDHGGSGSGALAAGGSTYYADMLAEPLELAGAPLRAGQRALEFGCASGRTVRVLAAAYPGVEWHACDPDRPAIEWAQANLPDVRFFVSDVEPPLPFPDAHLDVVNAHGVWTHFSQGAALRWFEEMHRVLKPGGHFVFTVHGNQSVQLHASDWGGWDRRQVADVATELYTEGHKFVGAYGRQGHHNLATPDWGEAFMTPEWVLQRLLPRWRLP